MANKIFNFATEKAYGKTVDPKFETKEMYREIWKALASKVDDYNAYTDSDGNERLTIKTEVEQALNNEFESFYAECSAEGAQLNGVAFQNKLKNKWLEIYGEAEMKVPSKKDPAKLEDNSNKIKEIAADALKRWDKYPHTVSMSNDYTTVVKTYFAQTAVDGYLPYDTVTTAGHAVAKGKNLQMGCGEGKTGVLVFATASKVAEGKQVFLTSSTSALAKETFDDTVKKYEVLGVNKDENGNISDEVVWIKENEIMYPIRDEQGNIQKEIEINGKKESYRTIKLDGLSLEEKKKHLAEAYSKKVVIADNGSIMQHKMAGFVPEMDTNKFTKRNLLADEADYVLLDQYRPAQRLGEKYSTQEQEQRTSYRKLARDVIMKLKATGAEFYTKDDKNQYVDFNEAGKKHVATIIKTLASTAENNGKSINMQQLQDLVYEALVVETVYKEGRDFQVIGEGPQAKIISEDRASGANIDLPQGVLQALEVKYGTKVTPESEVLNATNITRVYGDIFGADGQQFISGTLGLESQAKNQLKEMESYGCTSDTTYICSPQKQSIRQLNEKRLFKTEDEKRKVVAQTAFENLETKDGVRPVLIGCVSDQEVNKVVEELLRENKNNTRIIRYTAASENEYQQDRNNLNDVQFKQKYGIDKTAAKSSTFQDFIKNHSGQTNNIIVGTSIIGRGTTIKTNKDVEKAGGIHVIINGIHETSSRNQIQYAARTARGDNHGSVDEFFAEEELSAEVVKETGLDNVNISAEGLTGEKVDKIYEAAFKEIDERQSNVRTHVNNLMNELGKYLEAFDKSIEFPDRANEAKSLLTARAFSIQNRACGNASQEVYNEYSNEMKAFYEMYEMKYSSPSPESFNEVAWLRNANNGQYKKLADTYMEFTGDQVQEIVTKYGAGNKEHVRAMIEKAEITPDELDSAMKQVVNAIQAEKEAKMAAENESKKAVENQAEQNNQNKQEQME